jgi:hypothetical protein
LRAIDLKEEDSEASSISEKQARALAIYTRSLSIRTKLVSDG